MNAKQTRLDLIDPAMIRAGWKVGERPEFFAWFSEHVGTISTKHAGCLSILNYGAQSHIKIVFLSKNN